MTDAPAGARFSTDHLWVLSRGQGALARVGVTDFAQDSMGDVTAVTAPGVGTVITAGVACGQIESLKSANDLVAPVTGTVRGRNESLEKDPSLINSDPYGEGWLFDVEVESPALGDQMNKLMSASDYQRLVVG